MTEPDEESVRDALERESPLPPDPEAPVADALEQRQAMDAPAGSAPDVTIEADPGDVAEQQREVGYETDEEALRE
ncbi:hypothetical protein GCM10027445_36750 [Amycolatopsis endophytica]|uniref:DUF5709 domain-containing protein n=1 Tax=Amycolatopsis endophytica TaxID=860233 RepID=A0A853B7S3_9PSEU|nr:hypothetical protein [Amycolatopsis endophytica]NYI91050.1 hypothetical protein [Amycolatopsis endophytica]